VCAWSQVGRREALCTAIDRQMMCSMPSQVTLHQAIAPMTVRQAPKDHYTHPKPSALMGVVARWGWGP
jgi:hypothetical protein